MLLDGTEDIITFGLLIKCSCKSDLWTVANHTKTFSPTFFNSIAGLITTIINIYTARSGDWPIMAILTASITAAIALTSFVLIMVYQFGKLERIKQDHIREIDGAPRMVGSYTSSG